MDPSPHLYSCLTPTIRNQLLVGSMTPEDLTNAHDQLYQTTDKVKLGATLRTHVNSSAIEGRRPKVSDVAKRNVRGYTLKYCVLNLL